jgi:hypothetical protein
LQDLSEQAWNDMDHDLGIAQSYPPVRRQRR